MKTLVLLSALAAVTAGASAQTLFYGGDPHELNALMSITNVNGSGQGAATYDNFDVTAPTTITGVFGHFYESLNITSMRYEIRSGVSVGDGGMLIDSGIIATTRTVVGSGFGFDLARHEGTISPLNLMPGEYFITLQIAGSGTAYAAGTDGANGIGTPLNDDVAYFDSEFFGADFADSETEGADLGDFSFGLTTEAVPEPFTMALAGLALAGAARMRRRK